MCIKKNLDYINKKISLVAKNCGRDANSVRLIAVSKFHPVEAVLEACDVGQFVFGENHVQEATQKFISVYEKYPQTQLHIIGQLQTNKVKKAVQISKCIQSVDRINLLQEIEKQCAKINKKIEVMFEFHTGEDSKSGYKTEDELIASLEALVKGDFPHITPKGFMTMAPFTEDQKVIRQSFKTLRELSEIMQKKYPQLSLKELSMGMSNDFEIAIQEGATMVRVGTAIFGERDYSK